MASEKDRNFVDFLMELTRAGKLKWEATAASNEFAAGVKGKYKVVVNEETVSSGFTNYDVQRLNLRNVDDQELMDVRSSEYVLVRDLYQLARRNALNVDAALDEIMRDDIPF
jgi:hypothetical protein